MTLYGYVCPAQHTQEELRPSEERHAPLKCARCGRPMALQIHAAPGIVRSPAVPKRFTRRV